MTSTPEPDPDVEDAREAALLVFAEIIQHHQFLASEHPELVERTLGNPLRGAAAAAQYAAAICETITDLAAGAPVLSLIGTNVEDETALDDEARGMLTAARVVRAILTYDEPTAAAFVVAAQVSRRSSAALLHGLLTVHHDLLHSIGSTP